MWRFIREKYLPLQNIQQFRIGALCETIVNDED